MRKCTLLIASLIFAGLVSCNTETETETENTPVNIPEPEMAVPAPTNELSTTLSAPAPVPTTPVAAAPALKINPAHGQPGHDCSVAVGAPLNTGEAKATTPEVKINPAHGQPGHDCAVAVGAPLPSSNTKPIAQSQGQAPAATPAQPTARPFNPLGTPAPSISTFGNASSANLNPAHGQPGHNCDVAVGAPLPSR